MVTKSPKLTLGEIKGRSTGYFFDRKTMRFFAKDTYGVRYDRERKINYVYTLREGKASKGIAWWRFDPDTGKLHPLMNKPEGVRDVL